MEAQHAEGVEMGSRDFHLVGLISIFIASKYEDVKPIYLKKLLLKVAHNKFTQDEVIEAEGVIL